MASPFQFQVGYETDIGGGKENQDDFLFFAKPDLGVVVLCMFDGHGREVGKIAANSARQCLLNLCENNIQDLITNPTLWLISAHEKAHQHIKNCFKTELISQGYEISEDERSGYLLKRKSSTQTWTCVHGGSSSSIIVIIGSEIFIANVGDSSGILCCNFPILEKSFIKHIKDSAISENSKLLSMRGSMHSQYINEDNLKKSDTLVITAEHSPESPYEFYRLREFRHKEDDINQPSLLVVYDSPSHEKSRCNPVFNLDENGNANVTNNGK